MPVNYIICSAGLGSRFEQDFPGIPKPMIKLSGRYLLDWSLDSLPIYTDDTLIIITQRQHKVKAKLLNHIQNRFRFNNVHWLEIEGLTSGQLETAYLAKDLIDPNAGIGIFNCDTFFQSKTLSDLLQDTNIEGIIPCAQEKGDAWSFCKIDENDYVIDIAEKQRISDWCSVGFYFFRNTLMFLDLTPKYLQNAKVKETYVAPFYKEYLVKGMKLVIDRVTAFKPMGTPDQIEAYWQIPIQDVVAENYKKVLVIDIDDTLTIENPDDPYTDKKPRLDVITKLQEYKAKGYEIILHTARRMKTHKRDEAKVLADIGGITIDWLKKHNVPYDGIKLGKPYAENGFYVDDKTIRPDEFLRLSEIEIKRLLDLE